ncbi:hypothetical protein MJO28_005905 [Puccinia striiformis f. sp. tritici]|uniref:Uncharacterized protein n=1 Tax=Puccinia striiformis f. sp. tritici TaxID=168172 RepID=A0ACC0EFK7_9BASI|nr:hypothetical protein MJO28_005905 [Puccinia striiformis f. sp. tritici]KAI7957704.1 hypothetical protein MJO29_005921 [Puccinia striiformis f. sp. tritici]KAI9609754.1 hypothetical protein KEM48_002794 [Puccinia striiformis f. sp. tritici PST-130]KAI9626590.1 hypothetical protein H4Q26_017799 [Puccinia striiformis f. sp. tritici PST-130]
MHGLEALLPVIPQKVTSCALITARYKIPSLQPDPDEFVRSAYPRPAELVRRTSLRNGSPHSSPAIDN